MIKRVFLMAGLFLASCTVLHADLQSPQPTKIAYIRLDVLMGDKLEQTPHEWRDRISAIDRELKTRAEQITSDQQRLQKLAVELSSKEGSKWTSDEARQSKTEEAMKLRQSIELASGQAENYRSTSFQRAQADIFGKIEKVAETIALKKGFDLVLVGGGIWVNKQIDITVDVREELNKEYESSKAKKQKASAAASHATPSTSDAVKS
jgi:Skp family chaperone for outer membrane proteins